MIIGLTGLNCSGKDEVARILMQQGFEYFSLSDIIRDETRKRGLDDTRETLIRLGNELRKEFGSNILAKRTNEKIKGNAVVVSIRNVFEVNELRKNKNFVFVRVEAPISVRYERAMKRGRVENSNTLEEFRKVEEKEKSEDESKQQLHKVIEMADHTIINDSDIDSLEKNIKSLLHKIG